MFSGLFTGGVEAAVKAIEQFQDVISIVQESLSDHSEAVKTVQIGWDTFTGTAAAAPTIPSLPTLSLPPVSFSFHEEAYISALADELTEKLINDISGGTGIDATKKAAIIARETARDESVLAAAKARLETDCDNLGIPVTLKTAALHDMQARYDNLRADKARKITARDEITEKENIRYSVEQSVYYLNGLIGYYSKSMNRKLKAALATLGQGIAYYEAMIMRNRALVRIYEAQGKRYTANLKRAVASADARAEYFSADVDHQTKLVAIEDERVMAELSKAKAAVEGAVAKAEGAARATSQVAAGAMSAISVSVRASTHGEINYSTNRRQSASSSSGVEHITKIYE